MNLFGFILASRVSDTDAKSLPPKSEARMAKQGLDRARDVRSGEELETGTLFPYLRDHIDGLSEDIVVRQFPAGHSNLTYLLEDRSSGQGYVLRRPPFGAQVKSGHDMGREFRVMSALYPVWPKVPRPFVMCDDESIIGAPFYVMERVEGVILRRGKNEGVNLDEATMAGVCDAFLDTFVQIHGIDLDATGLSEFGKPEGYIERQVSGWTRRWGKAMTDTVEGIDAMAAWLAENRPEEQSAGLIHNDFKYDNLILDPDDLTQVRAVLDWEMATLGDPLMDLGSSLAYWVEAKDSFVLQQLKFGPTDLPGNLSREELVKAYAERSGRDVTDFLFYYIYGLFKLAVIAQQIYYRYKHGHTKDERFAGLIFAVQALGQAGEDAIASGEIGPAS